MQTFDTPTPISATVDVVLGDIRFIASDRADTVVEVHPIDPTRQLDVEAAEQVKIEFADGKLRLRHPKLRTAFTRKWGSVKVLVQLPTGSDVEGDTAQGEFVVQGAVGSCRLKTAIGDIKVDRAADARLRTTGGKVTVDHVSGEADISGFGDIRIGRIDGDAKVKNIGGAIGVGEFGGGKADLYAVIGKVEVGVPQGTSVQLDAHTPTGRVHNRLDAPERSDRALKLRARSNGGDIVVHRAGADQSSHN